MKAADSPFQFGQIIAPIFFVNRETVLERFEMEVKSGLHQIIISPRRWGKSSFVRKAAADMQKDPNIAFCFIDLFLIRSEQEFFEHLVNAVIKCTHTKIDELKITLSKFLSKLSPKISLSPDPNNSFDIDFNWKPNETNMLEALNLAENIAKKKGIRIVVCLDEFQNISEFTNATAFQKVLRSHWQLHKHVTYCMYGSKRSIMTTMFNSKSMPFYRFGTQIYLEKIDTPPFAAYIIKQFASTQKTISEKWAIKIVELMENHPYYVQQFGHFVWMNTESKVSSKVFKKAIAQLFMQNLILFQRDFEQLSVQQINVLKMLCDANIKHFTGKVAINKYNLSSSANVLRGLEGLETKEIIDRFTLKTEFVDPGFKLWVETQIFKTLKLTELC